MDMDTQWKEGWQSTSLINHTVVMDPAQQRGSVGWRRGVVVTALVVSTKLLYVSPG